jgi:hypothetical protein
MHAFTACVSEVVIMLVTVRYGEEVLYTTLDLTAQTRSIPSIKLAVDKEDHP